jgi:hypothetical protein
LKAEKLRTLTIVTTSRTVTSSPSPTSVANLRSSANNLIESANRLVIYVHAPSDEGRKGIEEFTRNFEQFHSMGNELAQRQKTVERKQPLLDGLHDAKEDAIDLLERLRAAQADKNNLSLTQALSAAIRQFSLTIWTMVEHIETRGGSAWIRECDQALQQIQSVHHLFGSSNETAATMYALNVPLNGNSYYESLAEVTNEARNLGDGKKREYGEFSIGQYIFFNFKG